MEVIRRLVCPKVGSKPYLYALPKTLGRVNGVSHGSGLNMSPH